MDKVVNTAFGVGAWETRDNSEFLIGRTVEPENQMPKKKMEIYTHLNEISNCRVCPSNAMRMIVTPPTFIHSCTSDIPAVYLVVTMITWSSQHFVRRRYLSDIHVRLVGATGKFSTTPRVFSGVWIVQDAVNQSG